MCVCVPGEEEEEEKVESGDEEEEEEGEEELVEEVGSHPFAAMTPDQDSARRDQVSRSLPPSQEEVQQRRLVEV